MRDMCNMKEKERENLARRTTLALFVPLILIGYFFYSKLGRSPYVFCSGIVALMVYFLMYINRYHLVNSFPEDSSGRIKHLRIHRFLCICLSVFGLIFLATLLLTIENMKKP